MPRVIENLRLGGALKTLIVIFWLFMVFLLVQRIHLAPTIEVPETEVLPESETWMSVKFKGQKIGYSYQGFTRTEQGYVVDQKSYLKLNLMGSVQEVRTVTTARLGKAMDLTGFYFFMAAGPIRYQLSGERKGLELELTGMTGGHRTTSSLRLEEVPKVAAGIIPFLTRQGMEKGQRFNIPIFDPGTLSTRSVLAVVEGRETLVIDGQNIETFRVRTDYRDTQSYAWVDEKGSTVREEGLLGFSMERTTADKATEGLDGRADLPDIVRATSAPADKDLGDGRSVAYLRVRLKEVDLTGFELAGGRQKQENDIVAITREVIDPSDQDMLPIDDPEARKYLEPTPFVQSDDRNIVAQARKLVGGETSPLVVIRKIVDWVYEELEKRPTMSVPSAVQVLESKVGDCNEHATLTAALLRAAGVPARIVVGVLYFDGRFYYHAWVEAWFGHWLAVDPLLGQVPADATHIRFLSGGITKQAEMVRLIGRLQLEIMERH